MISEEQTLNWDEVVKHPSTTDLMKEVYKSTHYDLFHLNEIFDAIDNESVETLNAPTVRGLTVLHFAAYVGNPLITTKLLHREVAVDPKDLYHCTPLHIALQSPAPLALGVAKMLLEHGADINAEVLDGGRALDYAILNKVKNPNETAAVKLVLDYHPEVNYQANEFTPLTQAVILQKNEAARLLLVYGANPDIPNTKGCTALYFAVKSENTEAVRLLMEHRANTEARDNDECTALCYSMFNKTIAIPQLLITNHADVNSRSKDHSTPLHIASVENKFDFVSLILKHGGRVNAVDMDGRTPLHYAAAVGNVEILNALLAKSAVTDAKETKGWVPLHLAAKEGMDECLKILINKTKKIDILNNDGLTALHIAVNENRQGAVKILIDSGANINHKAQFRTPLHAAIQNNNLGMTALLLENNASMDEFCHAGSTCISIAIQNKNLDMIKLLLQYKALLSPKNYFLDMHLGYCRECVFPEAMPFLREALQPEQAPTGVAQPKKPKKEKKPEVTAVIELSPEQRAKKLEEETKKKEEERLKKEAEAQSRAAEEAKKKEEKRLDTELKNAKEKQLKETFNELFDSLSALKSDRGATKEFFKGGMRKTTESYIDSQNKDYFRSGTQSVDRPTLAHDILTATGMKKSNPKLFEDLKSKFANAEKDISQPGPMSEQSPKSDNQEADLPEASAENEKEKMALNKALHQQDKLNEAKAAEQRKLGSSSTSAPILIGPSSQKEANGIKDVLHEVAQLTAPYQSETNHRSLLEMKYDLVKITAFISKLTTPAETLFLDALFHQVEELKILRNGALHLLEIHSEHSNYSQEALTNFFFDFYRSILSNFSVIATLNIEKDTKLSHTWARIQNKKDALPLKIKEIMVQMQNPELAQETFKQFSVHYKNHQLNKDNARSDVHDEIKNRVGILAAALENQLSGEEKVMLAVEIAELYRQRENAGYKNGYYPNELVNARNDFAHEGKDIPDDVIDHFLRAFPTANMKNK